MMTHMFSLGYIKKTQGSDMNLSTVHLDMFAFEVLMHNICIDRSRNEYGIFCHPVSVN